MFIFPKLLNQNKNPVVRSRTRGVPVVPPWLSRNMKRLHSLKYGREADTLRCDNGAHPMGATLLFAHTTPWPIPHLRLYRQRIERDHAYIASLAEACESLWNEVSALLASLESMKEAA